MIKILGIESSCDETSASVVQDSSDTSTRILSNVIRSQHEVHRPYGGVVPELSSRAHIDVIDGIIEQALDEAKCSMGDIDAVAVTSGPGLIGGVIVGVMTAKGLASVNKKPLIGVNHLEGHALTVRMSDYISFPYLLFLISGGHCQILLVEKLGKYKLLGQTLDDALGEAFDKTAKILGLGYPGGAEVEKRAKLGDASRFKLPKPLLNRDTLDFSFSGLKTAVLQSVEKESANMVNDEEKQALINDMCASFQATVTAVLAKRLEQSLVRAREDYPALKYVVLAGGVAANQMIGSALKVTALEMDAELIAPPMRLCTDNAAMIAWAGLERFKAGQRDDMTLKPKARWPIAQMEEPT